MSENVASLVNKDRLWTRLMQMARHGETPAGGVNRQALSTEEIAARRDLIDWGAEFGLSARADPAGNLFLRLEGRDAGAPPVMSGSHLDSQPNGGKFDGVYGVLAALEAVQAIKQSGEPLARAIEIVAWMNEEGSRFAPGMMGTSAYAGAASLADILPVCDSRGTSVAAALKGLDAAFPGLPLRPLGGPVAAYVEAHIEQGPLLERKGFSVGVVTGMQGKRTFRVVVKGETAHAGTSIRAERKDALLAATAVIQALAAAMHDAQDIVKFTVGRLDIKPNVPSVVAAEATFSIDLRHPDAATLRDLGDRVPVICAAAAQPCKLLIEELVSAVPLQFPVAMRELVRESATALGIKTMDILSSAGHDARYLHDICPAAMIFVPCKDGVSHNEAESATPEDLYDGTRVLAQMLFTLAH